MPAGAGSGADLVARTAPHGYTLLHALTTLSINLYLYNLTFDPLQAFVRVALANENPRLITCGYSGGFFQLGCALIGSASCPLLVKH